MLCKREGCSNGGILRRGWCTGCYGRWKRTGSPVPVVKPKVIECSFNASHAGPFVKGLCKNCYYRVWHTGTADYKVRPRTCCLVEGCDKWAVAKGLCDTHRKRVERKGSVEAGGRPEWWGNRKARRARSKDAKLRKHFDITLEQYNATHEGQNGLCKICSRPETRVDPRTGFVFDLGVDHNHDTKKTRELLCMDCNTGLGLFGDSPETLEAAASYLRKHQS